MLSPSGMQNLVHKSDDRNIWVHDAQMMQDGTIELSFAIPTSVRPRFAEYVEVQRQATHALAHASLGIPVATASLLSSASLLVLECMPQDAPFPRSGSVVVRHVLPTPHTRADSRDIEVEVDFYTVNGHVAHGRIRGKYLPHRVLDRVRGSAPALNPIPEPVDTAAVPSPRATRPLVESLTNPILSDHDHDHVSGMAIICAVEEFLGDHCSDQRLSRLSTVFYAFVEKTLPAFIEVEVGTTTARATVRQEQRICAISEASFDTEPRKARDAHV